MNIMERYVEQVKRRKKIGCHSSKFNMGIDMIFNVLPKVNFEQIIYYFKDREVRRSQKSNVLNNMQIKVKMKKLWSFKDNLVELKSHFRI